MLVGSKQPLTSPITWYTHENTQASWKQKLDDLALHKHDGHDTRTAREREKATL